MQQTVNAMKTILGEMRDQDYITIIRQKISLSENKGLTEKYSTVIARSVGKKSVFTGG